MPIAFRQYLGTVGTTALLVTFAVTSAFAQTPIVSEFDPTVWLGYELNHRPDWVHIPLAGLLKTAVGVNIR